MSVQNIFKIFLKNIYHVYIFWKISMHKNAIKTVRGGQKPGKKPGIPVQKFVFSRFF